MDHTIFKVTIGILCVFFSEAALPTGCDAQAVTCPANSVCGDDNDCACNDGFKVDGNACIAKVIGDPCDETNGCTGLANTGCTDSTCKCNTGYAEKDNVCTKIIGSACTGTAACPGAENTICKDDKCECKEDFAEKNDVCTLTVSGKDCSDTSKCEIDNAVCDTETSKCKCDADFTMNVNKCDPKNAAAMAGFGAIVLSLSVLSACLMMF